MRLIVQGEQRPSSGLDGQRLSTRHPAPLERCLGITTRPTRGNSWSPRSYGVDFPNVCLSQAYYDLDRRALVVSMGPGLPKASGQPTSFRVNNVDTQRCRVTMDGQPSQDWRIVGDEIEITTNVAEHTFVISQQWG